MRLFTFTFAVVLASLVVADDLKRDADSLTALSKQTNKYLLGNLTASSNTSASVSAHTSKACTAKNIVYRREFGSLSRAERKAYTDAVLCLQAKGAHTPAALVPGAKSRVCSMSILFHSVINTSQYDDFIATHINQTQSIHFTGTFLAWHRYFTWVYEQALRNECGYKGYQPYWEWSKYAAAPQDSPLFNGDDFSLSGNGVYTNSSPIVIAADSPSPITLDRGLGGGCITSGPFKNMVVNLGPVSLANNATVGPDGGLGWNPRCLSRDIGPGVATKYTNYTAVLHLILANNNIYDFEMEMQGAPGYDSIGVHGGGHYTIGGDPGGDFYTSPGDPAFYAHHAQIDRVWTIWQSLDLKNRQNAINGTETFLNEPPSAEVTLDTPIELGYSGGTTLKMRDLMSPVAGPFCYLYV